MNSRDKRNLRLYGAESGSARRSRYRVFSLKWKALLLTSLVLVVVTMAVSWRGFVNLSDQFDRHREAAHGRHTREVQALIEQSLERLRQLGGVIPWLPGMQQGLAGNDIEQVRKAFESQWTVLQFDMGIEVVNFYDPAGRLLVGWDVGTWNDDLDRQARDWVDQVNSRETPVMALNCKPACLQYAVVPVLAQGQSVGAVLLGSSLADVVRSFRQISGNDIGLLAVDDGSGSIPKEPGRRIPEWNARVMALTNMPQSLEVLRQAARLTQQPDAQGTRIKHGNRAYEVRLIPLPGFTEDNAAQLAVIADITDTLGEIRASSQELLVAGISGWLLAELLLLLILWNPMSRLWLTAHKLPLLAQSQFGAVRDAIAARRGSHNLRFQDEIDLLDETTIALADRLEELEYKVEEHTRALNRRMEELAMERDFVANLLDTAQVIIITQDSQGRIVMANLFTQYLTGYDEKDMGGRNFIDLLLVGGLSTEMRQRLSELFGGEHGHLRHEAVVTCKDGALRNITWYHSRLSGRGVDGPAVLSVGLDNTERKGAETRLAWLSDHDPLTGLFNRHRFQEELELMVTAARRQGKTGALLFIDLDQFKYINDTSGHHSGDSLLKVVATTLSTKLVEADLVARLGGDEFAILLRESDADRAARVAGDINTMLNGVGVAVNGQVLRVSASIGIALFPNGDSNVADLMAFADLAMYQAKEEGRGNWHLFSEEDQTRERMHNRVYWKDKVSQALAEDGFLLYYQPIMEIASSRVSHYEVLLRMRGSDGSVIGAAHFIDAAERSGMIHAVDRLVLAKAMRRLAEINRQGVDAVFSINLSGHAFNDPELLPHIQRELAMSGVDSARVVFEITETAAVADFAVATNLMLAIKAMGCRFALDDFGIGFSSFYYLKHLPVDYLKIDGSFIRQLPDNPDDQTIVKALAQVAAGFGKKTIAEYVENQATFELLKEYGIDYAQGYFISKAVSAEDAFGKPIQVVHKNH